MRSLVSYGLVLEVMYGLFNSNTKCYNYVFQVNAEFSRITTVPLLSTFLSQLDYYTDKLMGVFRKKGGKAGRNISLIVAAMDKLSGRVLTKT